MVIRFRVSKASFFAYLVLLSAVAIASDQTGQHKPLPTEPLEKYDNPPTYFWGTGLSPGMVSRYDTFTSYQVNVDSNGHNITGDAANEPSIAVDPTNPSKMTIGWRQFNSVQSNFRQGGWGYTTDGGTSWTFPGVLENNVFRSDPVLNSNETGTFFYLSLLQTFCDDVWRSLNGGQSWTRLPPEGGARGGDKEWFTIDKTNGIGHGFQYQAWSTAAACSGGQFSRSTDGGVTWMSPINIPNSPVWGTLDVDTNGNLFIGGGDFGSQFYCIRSSNAQNGNVTPTFDQITTVNLGGSIEFGAAINPGGLAGQIFLAVDHSGTSTNNNVYMLASVQPTGASNGIDVMFVRSTNGGQTFSAPRRINDDPINHNKWHWFGTLSVAPNGRIDSVWLDTRNAANNTDSQLFYSFSTDGGNTWSPNVAVSNSFNPFLGYPNQNKIGDYMTIVSDNTAGNVAYPATFNLEEDIYYVRVVPGAGGLTLLSAASRLTHGSAGTFDINMPLTGTSGVEDRDAAGSFLAVFTFDAPVTSGNAAVVGGTATAGTPTFSGNEMRVPLTGVADIQIVTIEISNVNGGGGTADVNFGFLKADVNASRTVDRPDLTQIQTDRGQIVNGSNFRDDINLSGRVDIPDKNAVSANRGHHIP
jgi:hypothetical protein